MFEISELKAKKLPELQELAKQLNVPKYRSFKKLDLVYQILDYQAANPQAVKEISKDDSASNTKDQKSSSQNKPQKNQQKNNANTNKSFKKEQNQKISTLL